MFFAAVQGTTSISIWENIDLDLQLIPDHLALGRTFMTGWVTPFIRVTNGLEKLGFITAPDARYKIGSYNYGSGYTIVRNEDESIVPTRIKGVPHYIVFPTQILEVSRFSFEMPAPDFPQYEVKFEPNLTPDTNVWIINPRRGSSNSPNNLIASTINFYFDERLTVDIKIFYCCDISALQYFGDDREFQPVLL